jgi:hypothetical protein
LNSNNNNNNATNKSNNSKNNNSIHVSKNKLGQNQPAGKLPSAQQPSVVLQQQTIQNTINTKQAAKKPSCERINQIQKPKQESNFIYMLDSDVDAEDGNSDANDEEDDDDDEDEDEDDDIDDDDESDDDSSEFGLSDDYDDDIVNEAGDERECGSDSDDLDDESGDDIDSTIDDESSSSLTNSSWSHSTTTNYPQTTTTSKSTLAVELSHQQKSHAKNQTAKPLKSEYNLTTTKTGKHDNNSNMNNNSGESAASTAQSTTTATSQHTQQTQNLKRSRIAYQHTSGYSSDNPAEKRAFHILSERQRRNDLKKLFETLRVNVPSLNDKQKASKLTILKASVDYLNEINNKQMKLNLTYEKEKQKHLQLMHNLKVLQSNSK